MNVWKVRENLKERLRDGSMLMVLAAAAIVSFAIVSGERVESPNPVDPRVTPVASIDAGRVILDPVPGP